MDRGHRGRTGVEMEGLTAVGAAALTVYDMAKAVDRGMRTTDARLRKKRGGRARSSSPDAPAAPWRSGARKLLRG